MRALEAGSGTRGSTRPVVPAEVQARLHRELHAARIARHDREPVDAEWSATMTKLITGQLDREAAELQFKVTRVDCRNVSCVVVFEWPSRSASLTAEGALVQSLADTPCTREVLFEEAADPAGKVTASMVLECERAAPVSGRGGDRVASPFFPGFRLRIPPFPRDSATSGSDGQPGETRGENQSSECVARLVSQIETFQATYRLQQCFELTIAWV